METYYDPKDLAHFGDIGEDAPELWKKWLDWYNACFVEGALSEREKALIALAVAHTVQCPYCIDAYSSGCLEKGGPGADDRGYPCGGGHSQWLIACAWRSDAQSRTQALHVMLRGAVYGKDDPDPDEARPSPFENGDTAADS